MSRTLCIPACAVVLLVTLCGCQQPKMSEMMTQPPRPAELDQIDHMVGTWKSEMKFIQPGGDDVMTGHGMSKSRWMADKRILVEEYSMTMENGEEMEGIGIWMYDPKIKKFRTYWFSNWGMIGEGTAHRDADGKWHMKGKNRDLPSGMTMHGKGTAWMEGHNKMCWESAEYTGPLHLHKLFEMEGTSTRH